MIGYASAERIRIENPSYQVKLDIFEGPLDLLLHLIEAAEVDIYNIPIAEITDQFLAHLQSMESLNLQVAGDFLVMAATLIQIKVRMLLPKPLNGEEPMDEEEEDPRLELVERLIEYKRIKAAAAELRSRGDSWENMYGRLGGYFPDKEAVSSQDPIGDVTLWDLISAFKDLLESLTPRLELEGMPREEYSIPEKMEELMRKLKENPRLSFSKAFTDLTSRRALLTSFLALLELNRLRKVRIRQPEAFAEILIMLWEEV